MERVVAGKIGKPFGLQGDVYVHPNQELGDVLVPDLECFLSDSRAVTIVKAKWHRNRFIVRFEGITNRDQAETLRNQDVFVSKNLVALEDDQQWVDDLIGQDVVTPAGELVGTIARVADGVAHDYLYIQSPQGKEHIVPFIDEFINTEDTPFVLDAPPGLLDF